MTETPPLISIIIPVYKVEPYLRQCLDSVLAQTYPHWEAICINDGSPDNCGSILDEYAAKDSRFIVIHQENQGVSVARNRGLEIMQGKYVTFIDPDDWIEHDTLEHIYNATKVGNAELIQFGRINHEPDGITLIPRTPGKKICSNSNIYSSIPLNISLRNDMPSYCCTKVFLTSSIKKNKTKFCPNVKISEDFDFFLQYLLDCTHITYIIKELYHYRRCVGITDHLYTGNVQENDILSLFPLFNKIKNYKPSASLPHQAKRAIYYLQIRGLLNYHYSIKKYSKALSQKPSFQTPNLPLKPLSLLILKTRSFQSIKLLIKYIHSIIKL